LSKVRSGFQLGLLITLFLAFLLVSTNSIVENIRLRRTIAMQQGLLASSAARNKLLEKNVTLLKRELAELRAQKALYTATIETLAKK
jgi:cell division protein FtsB